MRLHLPKSRSTARSTAAVAAAVLAVTAGVSAHVVRGLTAPERATAFVSSPTTGTDSPIPVRWGANDSGLRIMCFYVANTSPARPGEPDWPRVTGVGFELPGTPAGFTLIDPVDGDWRLIEGVRTPLAGHDEVTLDFAIVTNPVGQSHGLGHATLGILPGQPAVRGTGTRFCVAGPFPNELTAGQPTTIEQLLNGVVVAFEGLDGPHSRGADVGVWENPGRLIPLYQP